jgi:hypothetical protein
MIAKRHSRRLNKKLTRITKGARGSLDYIETPTATWYYSPTENEIYHYELGVFKAHGMKNAEPERQCRDRNYQEQ